MTDKEQDKRRKCPVCGRFAKAEAVEKHEMAIEAMREALAECRQAISDKDGIIDTMKASLSAYETDHDELTHKVENQKGELSRREKTIAALRGELSERGIRIAEVEKENRGLQERLDAYRGRGLWARIINKGI